MSRKVIDAGAAFVSGYRRSFRLLEVLSELDPVEEEFPNPDTGLEEVEDVNVSADARVSSRRQNFE